MAVFGILDLLYAVEGQRLWIVSRAVGKITENDNFLLRARGIIPLRHARLY